MIQKHMFCISLFTVVTFFSSIPAFCQNELIKTIRFTTNSFYIDKKYEDSLDIVVAKMKSSEVGYLKIFGYSDTRGSAAYNETLSENRAMAVYDFLKGRVRIDTARLFITWLGESEEAYDLHFPAAHVRQRCVDVWVQFRQPKEPGRADR